MKKIAPPVFLEIKRKFHRAVLKERVTLPFPETESALNGADPSAVMSGRPHRDRTVFDRFRYNIKVGGLSPVVLICYEREAFLGKADSSARVTFDHNLRCLPDPSLADLFEESGLREFEPESFILELKFNDRIPRWMTEIMTAFNLRPFPYSKYCHAIDALGDPRETNSQRDRSFNMKLGDN